MALHPTRRTDPAQPPPRPRCQQTPDNTTSQAQNGDPAYRAVTRKTRLAQLNVTDVPIVPLVDTPNMFAMTSNVGNVNASLRTAIIIPDAAELSMK